MGRLDRISITGLFALAGVAAALYGVYGFSPVPPAPSMLGMVTGYTLVVAMATLWVLPVFGRRNPSGANRERYKTLHRGLGVAFIVLLAIHARSAGHAMLLGLMMLALVMALIAFFHAKIQAANRPALLAAWWVVHVGLAAAVSVMATLHIYAQYAYST
jgi:hypothetical protein